MNARGVRVAAVVAVLLALGGGARADDAAGAPRSVRTLAFDAARVEVEVVGAGAARAAALHAWIAAVAGDVEATFGRWPLARSRIRIEQVDSGDRSPVPWGQTSRQDPAVAVLLYVRRDATPAALHAHWTATHELAHLVHPYLGEDGRWLAEGLASYYQTVARARAGRIDEGEAWRALDAGFARGRRATTAGTALREAGDAPGATMRVYWAGAAYWLEADLALRAHGATLDAVLADHAACCLAGAAWGDPLAFVRALDGVRRQRDPSAEAVFEPLYRRHAEARAFPSLDAAYAALGLRSEAGRLRLSGDADAAALRRAIMGPR
ncbi:hypothetical protein [Cognatilysobacter tabacisoli]|uniref:hypothetical protein n=1 Tax=Cognatilysobacter tabacisoli TaxID=2315424 RepID=UPI0013002948|nr:hypothetical protein [Lysobacter tabacisoli]